MRHFLIVYHLIDIACYVLCPALLGYFFLGRFMSPLPRAKWSRLILTYLIVLPLMGWGIYALDKVMYDDRPPSLWRVVAPLLNAIILIGSGYISTYVRYKRKEAISQPKRAGK